MRACVFFFALPEGKEFRRHKLVMCLCTLFDQSILWMIIKEVSMLGYMRSYRVL